MGSLALGRYIGADKKSKTVEESHDVPKICRLPLSVRLATVPLEIIYTDSNGESPDHDNP
jgi:hypothetical protein